MDSTSPSAPGDPSAPIGPTGLIGPTGPGAEAAGRRLTVPLALLRHLAGDLAGVADRVSATLDDAPPAVDAGPAAAAIDDALDRIEAGLAGLAGRLRETGEALSATAADLARTDDVIGASFLEPWMLPLPADDSWEPWP